MQIDVTLLRRMRETSGLSLQDIAVGAGLSHQSVWRVLAGRHVAPETADAVFGVLRRAVERKRREADALLAQAVA